jgi:hypothetical protein
MGKPDGRIILIAALAALLCFGLCGSAFAAGDVNHPEPCPFAETSPGFRSGLPDCRAFELVSPPYVAGTIVAGVENEAPPMSPDGEHLLAVSFGAFAGTEDLAQDGTEYGAIYEFSRSPGGWTAEAQDPPASLYPRRIIETHGISRSELGRTVWLLAVPAQPGEEDEELRTHEWVDKDNAVFAIREPSSAGGAAFHVLGPASAPGHDTSPAFVNEAEPGIVVGVSADVTHVVFSVKDQSKELWPGDSTVQGSSLYEYDSAGSGEPVLVGVSNAGPLRGTPHVNEGAQLVSQCGEAYDGMSTSGEIVYFTAAAANQGPGLNHCNEAEEGTGPAVAELYARVSASQTVAISEPSKEDCALCNTTKAAQEAAPEGAQFQGTSNDGSEVFFTSKQELLTGASATSLYEYDFDAASRAARVTLVAADVTGVGKVTEGGTRIYFESTDEMTATPNANGEKALAGASNLYLYEPDAKPARTAFVASAEGAGSYEATQEGQFLVFESDDQHLGGAEDSSAAPQLFEYDAASGALVRVSIGQHSSSGYRCESTGLVEEGYDCDGNTAIGEDAPRLVEAPNSSISKDGTVVFSSELALTPGAVPGHKVEKSNGAVASYLENVYEYRGGQVYLISPGNEPTPAHYQDAETATRLFGIDETGSDIFFSTTDGLVPQDTDSQSSWYDAREEGGFPGFASPSECAGEACQGAVSTPPSLPSAGSTAASAGNAAPAPPSEPPKPKKTAAQVRAERLAKALKACKAKRNPRKRAGCERTARKDYGPVKKAKR